MSDLVPYRCEFCGDPLLSVFGLGTCCDYIAMTTQGDDEPNIHRGID